MSVEHSKYYILGSVLLFISGITIPTVYLLMHSIPFTMLGISLFIVGSVSIALGSTEQRISSELTDLVISTGIENLNSLLDSYKVEDKAIYLPAKVEGEKPMAFIRVKDTDKFDDNDTDLLKELIYKNGSRGIMVYSFGSNIMEYIDSLPNRSTEEIMASLKKILIGSLDLAKNVVVSIHRETVKVTIKDIRIKNTICNWSSKYLGSISASIAATLLAETFGSPITIESEKWHDKELIVVLKIQGYDSFG